MGRKVKIKQESDTKYGGADRRIFLFDRKVRLCHYFELKIARQEAGTTNR
jgi:hypothetical protein